MNWEAFFAMTLTVYALTTGGVTVINMAWWYTSGADDGYRPLAVLIFGIITALFAGFAAGMWIS